MFRGTLLFNGDISSWDVSSVTDMSHMFNYAISFNQPLDRWDVSSVTNMHAMFVDANSFNRPLHSWDVSSVTNMDAMFAQAFDFNQPIHSWNVSSVTDMSGMFNYATSFNRPLNSWNVSSVTDMSVMFSNADSFNQPIRSWDVSSVTDMSGMFVEVDSFNQPLGYWNVSAVTDMDDMFLDADDFEQNLGGWYVTLNNTVIDRTAVPGVVGYISAQSALLDSHDPTYRIETGPDSDRFDIVSGNLLNMTSADAHRDTYTVILNATGGTVFEDGNNRRAVTIKVNDDASFVTTWTTASANQSITIPVGDSTASYDVDWGDGTASRNVSGSQTHAYDVAGTYTVSITGGFERIFLDGQQPNAGRLSSIEQWGNVSWTSMSGAFHGASNMAYNAADAPDLSRATTMQDMFRGATSFDGGVSGWDVSGVTDMAGMFEGTTSFNSDISPWNVSAVTDMSGMFEGATSFNSDISPWNVSAVTDMSGMFEGATSFNSDISPWNVSAVTDMSGMFEGATSFNSDISPWNVSAVTDMSGMFEGATSFNSDISPWNVSAVTDMAGMFAYGPFNQDVSTWNVSAVTDMAGMFEGATSFNQDVSTWDVSAATDMGEMFLDADDFEQNLGRWYVTLGGGTINGANGTLAISAQNAFLDGQNPTYGIDGTAPDDHEKFVIAGRGILGLNPSQAVPPGTYHVTITSAGGFGTANSRAVEVGVSGTPTVNRPPTADAGAPQTVPVNQTVTLDGAGSRDPDGDRLAYQWRQTSGGTVGLSNPTSPSPTFTAPSSPGTLGFELSVTDGSLSDADATTVTVQPRVVARASTDSPQYTNADTFDVTIDFGKPVNPNYGISRFAISVDGGRSLAVAPADDAGHAFTFTIRPYRDGPVTAWMSKVVVFYQAVWQHVESDRVGIISDRTPPTVTVLYDRLRIAHNDASYVLPEGSCSDETSGPTSASPTVTHAIDPHAVGSYQATYACADRAGNAATLTIPVMVEADAANRPPVARTAHDHHYNRTSAPALHVLSLDGSLSYDPDGDALSYRWAQVSGPAVTITDPASRYTTFGMTGPPSPATLVFELTVSDGQYSSTDRYTVQVDRPRTGEPPAGPPPGYPVLAFTGSSPAGPLSASISVDFGAPVDPRSFTVRDDVAVNGESFRQGVGRLVDWDHQYFTFRLVAPSEGTFAVTVRAGAVAYLDGTPNPASNALEMTFENGTVSFLESALAAGDPPQANSPPTVDAGQDDSVREGLSFTLNGSATDPDGDSLAYLWSHDSDLEIGLSNPGSPTPSFTAPPVDSNATITFTLTVTDQHNATSASVRITVTDAPVPPTPQRLATQPPVARPGSQPVPALSTVATAPLEYATITVDFGRPIKPSTLSISDISVTGGDASGLSPSPGDRLFTFEVTHNDDDTGRLTVRIPAGAVDYPDGTHSAASNVLSLTFDRMGPVPAISTGAPSPTNAASMAVTVDFGEPVGALDLADVRVAGGTASGLSQEGAAASFTVTPDGDGQVEVLIPDDAVKDLAGNPGSASNRIAVTFDATPPTVTVNATSVRIPLGSASHGLPDGACGDATSGPVSTTPAVTHSIDASVAGSYQVTYECADRAGNAARTAITATVYEPAPEAGGTPARNATIALRGGASVTVTQGYHHDAGAICRADDGTWWDARSSFTDVATSGGSVRNYYVDLGEHTITYTCGEGYAATATRAVTVTDAPPAFDWGDYPDYVLCVDITDGVMVVQPDGNGDYACTDSHGHTITASGPP